MATLLEITQFCDERTRKDAVSDFPGALNGLQCGNSGSVTKVGAAVDAGLIPFEKAAQAGIDLLIVHHGLFWNAPHMLTGHHYNKIKTLVDSNIAVYSSHLPLDCHPEIGNNASIAKALNLTIQDWVLPFEGVPMMPRIEASCSRDTLKENLSALFSGKVTAIEYGPTTPKRIGICSGSGASVVSELKKYGIDTLITGELRQNHFNQAQEEGLNLYLCGHYATEVFGVKNLAQEVAQKFNLPYAFISTECPL